MDGSQGRRGGTTRSAPHHAATDDHHGLHHLSTPLARAARLLQTVLPLGWHVEVADTEPTLPTLRVLRPGV
jgi:hypothetical protein